jgi:hypothetical protein
LRRISLAVFTIRNLKPVVETYRVGAIREIDRTRIAADKVASARESKVENGRLERRKDLPVFRWMRICGATASTADGIRDKISPQHNQLPTRRRRQQLRQPRPQQRRQQLLLNRREPLSARSHERIYPVAG